MKRLAIASVIVASGIGAQHAVGTPIIVYAGRGVSSDSVSFGEMALLALGLALVGMRRRA